MRRILMRIPVIEHGENDIFRVSSHEEFLTVIKQLYGDNCPNVGNRLWFQGIMSELQSPENKFDFYNTTMDNEFINENYDVMVAPMANVFAVEYLPALELLAKRLEGIKIPVYVIACGIQAKSYDKIDDLIKAVGDSAKKAISAVYNTGGEFALRGYFTKEFFDRLGFKSAVVTGCPSMFQMGRNLQITQEKQPIEKFKPLFNGHPDHYVDLMEQYPTSAFFDQNVYCDPLLNAEYFNMDANDHKRIKRMVKTYGLNVTQQLLNDRIHLIPNMNMWREYLRKEQFNFSYGSRIHGSIMPILSGIPALLESQDARTKEMAEFFSLPIVSPGEYKKVGSLYDLYLSADYTEFNKNFASRFDAYENFLKKCGLVDRINVDNQFFYPVEEMMPLSLTTKQRAQMKEKFERQKNFWKMYAELLKVKRRLF